MYLQKKQITYQLIRHRKMSYFFAFKKPHLLSHQIENISLATKLHLTALIFSKNTEICTLNKTIYNY